MPTDRSRQPMRAAFLLLRLRCAAAAGLLPTAAVPAAAQAPPAAAPAGVTLHPARVRQAMYGFGGSQTYNGDALLDFKGRDKVYQALFQDLKLDIFRLRNYHGYDGQQAAFEKKTKDFADGARRFGAAKARGAKGPVRLMFTSWSPPASLKSNRRVSGRSDGTDKGQDNATLRRGPDGAFAYAEFADWWLASLKKFKSLTGVYPDYAAIQNEPDFPATYEGCSFLPVEGVNRDGFPIAGYDRALAAVSDRLRTSLGGAAPKLLGPETFSIKTSPGDRNHVQSFVDPATPAGRETLSRLFGVSFHLYGTGAANPANPALFRSSLDAVRQTYHARDAATPLFETEYLEGDTLTSLAGIVSDTVTYGEASAYLVWIVARSVRQPGYALVYYNPADGSVERRERFYAIKHFSAFVGEGWHRIEAECGDGDVKLSAFLGPDGREMAAVLVNPTDREKRIALAIDAAFDKPLPTAVYRSTEGEGGERWRELGALPADGVVVLPKRSVVTVTWGAAPHP